MGSISTLKGKIIWYSNDCLFFTLFTTKSSEISATPLRSIEQRDQSQEEQNQREDPAPTGRIIVMEKKYQPSKEAVFNNDPEVDREKNEERNLTSLKAATASPSSSSSKGTHYVESGDRHAKNTETQQDLPDDPSDEKDKEGMSINTPGINEQTNCRVENNKGTKRLRKAPMVKSDDFLW